LRAIAAARLPADADPTKGPVKLSPIKLEDGWLGNRDSVKGTFAEVASWKDYSKEREVATWFPNRAAADTWRAWQTKESPVELRAKANDSSTELAPFDPKKSWQIVGDVAKGYTLSVAIKPGLKLAKVEYFAEDVRLGEGKTEGPREYTWPAPPAGCRAVYAHWTSEDGKIGVTNPALFVTRESKGSK
jgi:hypothetical protein